MDRLAVAMFHTHGTDVANGRPRCGKRSSFDNGRMVAAITQKTRCREIAETDLDAVADLLTRGFVGRSRDYWMQGLHAAAVVRPNYLSL